MRVGRAGDKLLDTNSGIITKIKLTVKSWEVVDLGKSITLDPKKIHSTNGLGFTTIQWLNLPVGRRRWPTNAGSPSKRLITYMSLSLPFLAAILSIDLDAIEALPTQTDNHVPVGHSNTISLPWNEASREK